MLWQDLNKKFCAPYCIQTSHTHACRELTRNSQLVRNKNKENTRQIKQSHVKDNIYAVQQFAYVYGVARISLLSRKIQSVAVQFFSLSKKLHLAHRIHNELQNGPKSKPSLYRLNLRKSPIKNYAALFQVGSSRQLDQTQLGSTKPNNARIHS